MLKIIDYKIVNGQQVPFDLKELEKFGFTKRVLFDLYKYSSKDGNIYIKKDRTICISNFIECDMHDLSVLYDLIKADLVEKVGE